MRVKKSLDKAKDVKDSYNEKTISNNDTKTKQVENGILQEIKTQEEVEEQSIEET